MSTVGVSVGAIIPYRMTASRLPGKPLADVSGRSALERVVDRVRASRFGERVCIATTTDPTDDILVDYAKQRGLVAFRGSVNDVLARLTGAAQALDVELVLEVDGDDLLCSSEYMNEGIALAGRTGADFVSFLGLPIGATPNIIRLDALERACREKSSLDTSTGFFRFILEGSYKVERPVVARPDHLHDGVRMTLDYAEDLSFFRTVYAALDRQPGWSFADLVVLLRTKPELVAINQGLDEAYKKHFEAGSSRQ
jgi:spore coat polysaccharide biosynthesis protein SpsF